MGQTNPLAKKKKSRIYVICFLSIVLLCVIASGLSQRIKSLFRLTTHLLILLFTTVFPVLDTCTFSYSIPFLGKLYNRLQLHCVFKHPVHVNFLVQYSCNRIDYQSFVLQYFKNNFSKKCDIFINKWFILYFKFDTIFKTKFNFFL